MGQTTESPTLFSRVLENPGAPPLVILHGLLGSSDNWQTLAKRYQTDFEVHLLDARNHGRSPHVPTHTPPRWPPTCCVTWMTGVAGRFA